MIYRKIFSRYKKGDFYREGKRERIAVMLGVLVLLCVIGCAFMREEPLTEKLEIGIFGGEQTVQVWTEEQDVWIFLPSGADEAVWRIPEHTAHTWQMNGEQLQNGNILRLKDGESAALTETGFFGINTWEYTVHVLKSENIGSLYLETESGTMDYIHETKKNSEKGYVKIADAEGKEDYSGSVSKIKGRGNYTWLLEKKSYTLTFEEQAGLLGMPAAEQWILIACAEENTHMRNRMVFEMMREAGVENVQQSRWVDVYLNGEYAGDYLLTRKVELPEIAGNGDWMAEIDAYWQEEEAVGFITGEGEEVAIIEPENASAEKQKEIADVFEKIEDELDIPDEKSAYRSKWRDVLDEESMVKKYLLDELAKCPDGFYGSNYCYLKNGRLYFGAPWDYEFAFGNQPDGYSELELPDGLYHQHETLWYRRLCRDKNFMEEVRAEYAGFFRPYLENAVYGMLDGWAEEIRKSMKMDTVRWGRMEDDFEYEMSDLKGFIADRLSYLDKEWLGIGDGSTGAYHTLTLMNGDTVEQIYHIRSGSCVEPEMLERDSDDFQGWFEDAECTRKEAVSEKPLATDVVLYSKYSGISARKRLLVGMIPLAVLGLILTGWVIYTLRQERK